MEEKSVVLVDGTIGVGKSTFGRELALRFEGSFLDGDAYKTKGKPWYCSSLQTCRALLRASTYELKTKPFVFIARPVRCLDWLYFRTHYEQNGVTLYLIGLQATFENITNKNRGRSFSQSECLRMVEMIKEGYGARSFSDFHMRTDQRNIEETSAKLEAHLKSMTKV